MRENLIKVFSLIVGIATFGSANAATARPSVVAATMARMPTMGIQLPNASVNLKSAAAGTNPASCSNPAPEQLTAARCITRYNSCLRQDSVCGENFEICDSVEHFDQKRIYCVDVLRQCPAEAFLALFGNPVTITTSASSYATCDGKSTLISRTFTPSESAVAVNYNSVPEAVQTNQIAQAIADGIKWAAANAVTTCKNVADACIVKACKNSPQKCIGNGMLSAAAAADIVNVATASGATNVRVDAAMMTTWVQNMGWEQNNVKNYVREQCQDEIGSNRSCFITTYGKYPSQTDLLDQFNKGEIYTEVMGGVTGTLPGGTSATAVGRWAQNQGKVKEWVAKAVVKSVETCGTALNDCAINACGNGSMAVCYAVAKNASSVIDITAGKTNVANACKIPVLNEQTCKDVFLTSQDDTNDMWESIWTGDKTNAISSLNKKLSTTFNETSIASIRRQCQTDIETCATEACGGKYLDTCFHRDGKTASVMDSSVTTGGSLDRGMLIGLCIGDVKKSQSCDTYFDMEYAKNSNPDTSTNGLSLDWTAIQSDWINSGTSKTQCIAGETYNTVGDDNKTVSNSCAAQEATVFNNLMNSYVIAAESNYRHKKEIEMQKCLDNNYGGGGTFTNAWIKEPTSLTAEQAINGIGNTGHTATSDLFGALCRVQVLMSSSDPSVNDVLKSSGKAQMYFPMGTTFMCGSNLSMDEMEKMACIANGNLWEDSQCKSSDKVSTGVKILSTVGGLVGGAALGGVAMNALQNKTSIGNVMGSRTENAEVKNINDCIDKLDAKIVANRTLLSDDSEKSKFYIDNPEECTGEAKGIIIHNFTFGAASAGGIRYAQASAYINEMKNNKENILPAKLKKQEEYTSDSAGKTKKVGNIAGGVVGAALATTAAWTVINAVEESRDEEAKSEARKWMKDVGDKVQCMYRGETVPFGTVATIEW